MREREIFMAASEIESAEQRREYVKQACGEDIALRQRIEELLEIDRGEHRMLSHSPVDSDAIGTAAAAEEVEGATIGRYKLLEKIGEGGFALVYMAEQTEPVRRRVALKIIKAGMDTNQVVARFEAERQALALMDHPNIAKVFDGGMTPAGRPYFVMELVGGTPITEFCDSQRLTTVERLGIFLQMCRAVQHAHQKGIIHRDLKPSNILVAIHDDAAVPKVIDFGIAKATQQPLTDKTLFTRFHQFIGTPAYMSPEQATLGGADIDTRSDVYSLGAILYELLVGVTPLDRQLEKAAYDEVSRVLRDEQPARPSARISTLADKLATVSENRRIEPEELRRLVRGDLDWIIMKALEKDRNRRYDTANGLAMDVQRFLADEPVLACPPSSWYRFKKFARRNQARLAIASLVLLILLIGAISGFVLSVQRGAALERVQKERDATKEAERLATRRLFDSYLNEARALRSSLDAGRYFSAWNTLQKATALAPDLGETDTRKLRNEAVAIMALRADLEVDVDHEQSLGNWFVAFDHQLKYFAGPSDFEGTVVIRNTADGREAVRLHAPEGHGLAHYLRYSPDGRYLAVWYQSGKYGVWDLKDLNRSTLLHDLDAPHSFRSWSIDFSPESSTIAMAAGDQAVQVYALPELELVQKLVLPFQPYDLRFHPAGRQLALAYGADVEIWELDSSARIRQIPQPAQVLQVAWHPSGKYLATSCNDQCSYVWDAETGQRLAVLAGTYDTLFFNHAGDILATHATTGITKLWDPLSGELLITAPSRALSFSQDDRKLSYCSSRRAGVWHAHQSAEYRVLSDRPGILVGHLDLDINSEGNVLATSANPGGIRLWDLRCQRQIGQVHRQDRSFNVLFHAPSQSLINTGPSGVYRWPYKLDLPNELLRIGPPQRMCREIVDRIGLVSISGDGRWLAIVLDSSRVRVVNLDQEAESVALDGHPVDAVALSRDGKWAVTTCAFGAGAPLWNARTGTLLKDLWPDSFAATAVFSANGQYLAVRTGQEYRCWRTGSWNEPAWKAPGYASDDPGAIAFTPDGRMFSSRRSSLAMQLFEAATGRELVTLLAPRHARPGPACFNPDGTQLVESNEGFLAIWDLRRIRARLADLGLDWDQPVYPPAAPDQDARPLAVEVDYGEVLDSSAAPGQ